jgi:hypothetical protein
MKKYNKSYLWWINPTYNCTVDLDVVDIKNKEHEDIHNVVNAYKETNKYDKNIW